MNSLIAEDENDMKHAELVKRVRTLIDKVDNDRFEDLLMVDALQRLAIDYHFDDEINLILTRRSMQIFQTDLLQHKNLYEVSLCFRILRQNGFHVLAGLQWDDFARVGRIGFQYATVYTPKGVKTNIKWATLCDAFLVEAKWFASGYIPEAEEYLKIGMVTSGVEVLLVHMFFLLGNGTNEQHVGLINHNHGIISSISKILRLWDDLGSASDENQDGHDGSYVVCFLNQHQGCSTKIARRHVMNLISDAWKHLNKECLSPNPFSATFTKASNNIARMVPLMYNYDDNSSLPQLDDYIKAMLLDDSSSVDTIEF
ncbi:hypothetical protein L1887_48357 [Cichorium endivia]|nr:hypothetical protein L1887_48357 [Cichorium endivia]